jgi:hypothetical protein
MATLVVALFQGSDAALVGWANLAMVVAMCGAHTWNAAASRRRRSVLLAPMLAVAGTVGALVCLDVIAIHWDDVLVAVFICWVPISLADIVAPSSTYLARRASK